MDLNLVKTELNNDLDLKGKLPFLGFHQANLAKRLQFNNPAADAGNLGKGANHVPSFSSKKHLINHPCSMI